MAATQALLGLERRRREEAPAWAVVTLDPDGIVVDAVGPFAEPEQALIEAGRADAAWRRCNPSEPPFRYDVVPLWGPTP